MESFKVALLQIEAQKDIELNLHKGLEWCRKAKALGADLALFPEMYQIGYFYPEKDEDPEAWKGQAIGPDSSFIQAFKSLAVELDMAIGLTYLEAWPDSPRNTVSIIDRHGQIVLTAAKVHTCDFGGEWILTQGEDFHVCTLDTGKGEVKLGTMICYDREFPESARILMLKGAEIILVPNACGLEQNRKAQLISRAYENMVGIAVANYAKGDCGGHSMAFDGIAFSDIDWSSRNMLLCEAGEEEGIFVAEFNLDALRKYRSTEVWGNAYRRPGIYGELLKEDVTEPFIRKNVRR
ncbi:MAG: carbon-nitrogen hydrolase family protein [Clostridia bacterium]|nr:carbon-nitrogen hydrolase family protein [Clostridia bacterium]